MATSDSDEDFYSPAAWFCPFPHVHVLASEGTKYTIEEQPNGEYKVFNRSVREHAELYTKAAGIARHLGNSSKQKLLSFTDEKAVSGHDIGGPDTIFTVKKKRSLLHDVNGLDVKVDLSEDMELMKVRSTNSQECSFYIRDKLIARGGKLCDKVYEVTVEKDAKTVIVIVVMIIFVTLRSKNIGLSLARQGNNIFSTVAKRKKKKT